MSIVTRTNCAVELAHQIGNDTMLHEAVLYCSKANASKVTGLSEAIAFMFDNKEFSLLEHFSFTFKVEAPVSVFRELMRERVVSYFKTTGKDRVFSGEFYLPSTLPPIAALRITASYEEAFTTYQQLLAEGSSPEEARLVLPVATYADMLVTLSLRELFRLESKTSKDDGSISDIFNKMLLIVEESFPITISEYYKADKVGL